MPDLRPHKVRRRYAARFGPNVPIAVLVDGAIPIDSDETYLYTKGSAGAFSVAAPGEANVGRKLTLIAGTDFAHVTTFTGTTLADGTTGLNTTWTSAAFIGSSLTVRAISATRWAVESFNLGTIAP
jgi:hypothetical protein